MKIVKITLEIEVNDSWKDVIATQENMSLVGSDPLTDGVACALGRKRLAEEARVLSISKLGNVKVKTFRVDYEGKKKKR